jgi:hypothetical protein
MGDIQGWCGKGEIRETRGQTGSSPFFCGRDERKRFVMRDIDDYNTGQTSHRPTKSRKRSARLRFLPVSPLALFTRFVQVFHC